MTDQKGHNPSISNDDPSQADANPQHHVAHKIARPANDPDNAAVVPAAPSLSTLVDIYDGESVDPVYQAKSHAISCAIQEIGMGKYQVRHTIRMTQKGLC